MEALAVAKRELKDAVVGGEDEDVACGVKNGGADFAVLEVVLHVRARGFVEGVVEVAGDLFQTWLQFRTMRTSFAFPGRHFEAVARESFVASGGRGGVAS